MVETPLDHLVELLIQHKKIPGRLPTSVEIEICEGQSKPEKKTIRILDIVTVGFQESAKMWLEGVISDAEIVLLLQKLFGGNEGFNFTSEEIKGVYLTPETFVFLARIPCFTSVIATL